MRLSKTAIKTLCLKMYIKLCIKSLSEIRNSALFTRIRAFIFILFLLLSGSGCPDVKYPPAIKNVDYVSCRELRRRRPSEPELPRFKHGIVKDRLGAKIDAWISKRALLNLRHFELSKVTIGSVRSGPHKGSASLEIPLTPRGSKIFYDWTSQHAGESLAVFIAGKYLYAPVIIEGISGPLIIGGGLSTKEAKEIAEVLKSSEVK